MLRVENLDVFYGDVQALDSVSLDIEQGAIVAIVGANGAGKTTLIRALAGMLPQARGQVVFNGADISRWPSHRVCDLGLGQVAEGRQVFPTLSVAENLDIGAMSRAPALAAPGTANACWRCFPSLPSGCGSRRARCPAASNRCSPSGAA
jgi:ABC-type branched-subunit amino acid transport system ATPase component